MRIIERVCLYLVVGFVAFSLLDGARADDEEKKKDGGVTQTTLSAQVIEITNPQGDVALRISASEGGGGAIAVFNGQGKRVAQLFARSDGDGELRVYDTNGAYRGNLGGDETGGYVNVMGPKGKTAAYIGSDSATGAGYAAIYAPGGKKGAEIISHAKGSLVATSNVTTGKRTAAFGTAKDTGDGFCAMAERDGQERIILAGMQAGGRVVVGGKEGRAVATLASNPKGGVLSLVNQETNREVVFLGAASDTGTGLASLSRPDGKRGLLQYTSDHGGQCIVMNSGGQKAAFLGVSANPAGNGLLYVARTDGKRLVEAGATAGRGGYMSVRNSLGERVLFLGSTTGTAPDDGVVEVNRRGDKLGVVLRGYSGGNSVRVYDAAGKVKSQLR